jgi:hypothetical protein
MQPVPTLESAAASEEMMSIADATGMEADDMFGST